MEDMSMCGSRRRFTASDHTKKPFSLCTVSMAPQEINTCDISRMVSEAFDSFNPNLLKCTFSVPHVAAYLSRNFNVILVDWKKLTYYPCYFSALGNTKLVAQCTAQVSFMKFCFFRQKVACSTEF